ncbi:hypothetical protein K438DRAFT_1986448 [Mycena galopus ATCC 62051]|nr:hypothetical protein K438DRAFT_1986448 [Mycena galopus ATCC 62051]
MTLQPASDPELTIVSTTNTAESAQYAGAFFPGGSGFTIGGGVFTSNITTHVHNPPQESLAAFRTFHLGDINLIKEICWSGQSSIVDRHRQGPGLRRMYSAKLGDRRVTIAMYQGDGAEEEWQKEVAKYKLIRHPYIMQLYGLASTRGLCAMVFHDKLIPFKQFIKRFQHSPVLTMYIQGYCALERMEEIMEQLTDQRPRLPILYLHLVPVQLLHRPPALGVSHAAAHRDIHSGITEPRCTQRVLEARATHADSWVREGARYRSASAKASFRKTDQRPRTPSLAPPALEHAALTMHVRDLQLDRSPGPLAPSHTHPRPSPPALFRCPAMRDVQNHQHMPFRDGGDVGPGEPPLESISQQYACEEDLAQSTPRPSSLPSCTPFHGLRSRAPSRYKSGRRQRQWMREAPPAEPKAHGNDAERCRCETHLGTENTLRWSPSSHSYHIRSAPAARHLASVDREWRRRGEYAGGVASASGT